MSFFDSFNISGSGLTAQRVRLDVIADNIANVSTTRTESGEPYRRRTVVLESAGDPSFSDVYNDALGESSGAGVRVAAIGEDPSDFKLSYDPANPDAGADGYVRYPNVELVTEMVDLIGAQRAYEANATAMDATKAMAQRALQIGQA